MKERSFMQYNLDLERISVEEYRKLLKQQNLLPGRMILLQDIDRIFAVFESQGIASVAQLKKSLSTSARLEDFATTSSVPVEYLVILRREIGSMEQKPIPLSSLPGVDANLLTKLGEAGIKTTRDYWEKTQETSDELSCLCDLVRINGVGPSAARAFYEAGYRSVSEVAGADAIGMLECVSAVNSSRNYYKATLGSKDMQFCIDFALLLKKYGT